MPDYQRSDPPYLQISRYYREKILSGDLAIGEKLPSAREMRSTWGIAKATASRVSQTLYREGLVELDPGVGLRVTGRRPANSGIDHMKATRRTGDIYAPGQYAKIISAKLVPGPLHITKLLGLQDNAPVIRRERIRYQGEFVINKSVTYNPGIYAAVAPALLSTEPIKGGTSGYLEGRLGRYAVVTTQTITSRLATPEEVSLFCEVKPASPFIVLIGTDTLVTAEGEVIEAAEVVSPATRAYQFEFDIPAPSA